ncbi:hypothetical protein PAI11_37430 [Patulibacter medicamentivorans]|uniref:Uncharacterized protein n=1 Tax=Patulibacter medicamentivorans TaxID=1097667 RepID=H0EA69_9ACTN|nr:hypothetical protein [Patulibacter medicamentivorans]EHN09409.1 hypothetical protein PAI11_37430 [Patulibacter medicamentivorans]
MALPKPPGQTRRRNLDQPNWTTLTDDDVPDEVPEFPGRKPSVAALVYWTAIFTSPIGGILHDVDHFGIARLCRLHSKAEQGKINGVELGELRQLEQMYGLSPWARRRLQWEIDRVGGPGTAHDPQRTDELQRRRDERRGRMEGTGT